MDQYKYIFTLLADFSLDKKLVNMMLTEYDYRNIKELNHKQLNSSWE